MPVYYPRQIKKIEKQPLPTSMRNESAAFNARSIEIRNALAQIQASSEEPKVKSDSNS